MSKIEVKWLPEAAFCPSALRRIGVIHGEEALDFFFFAGAVRARSSDGHQSIGLDCPFPRMRIK